jgi:hypothetical protein
MIKKAIKIKYHYFLLVSSNIKARVAQW